MSDSIRIILKIAGREYPLTIDRKDEEKYRKAAKEVNDLVTMFSKSYGLDSENFLAMAALQLALKNIYYEDSMDFTPIINELKRFEADLDTVPGGVFVDKQKKK